MPGYLREFEHVLGKGKNIRLNRAWDEKELLGKCSTRQSWVQRPEKAENLTCLRICRVDMTSFWPTFVSGWQWQTIRNVHGNTITIKNFLSRILLAILCKDGCCPRFLAALLTCSSCGPAPGVCTETPRLPVVCMHTADGRPNKNCVQGPTWQTFPAQDNNVNEKKIVWTE
jgi:hypothetical protein